MRSEAMITQAKELILTEYALHPAAELTDYCKLFFQALYGPGHLIRNEDEARSFLKNELKQLKNNEEPPVQDLSFVDNDYCRVNLQVISKNLIKEEDFFERFVKSARKQADEEDFLDIWLTIERLISQMNVTGSGFDMQRMELHAVLKKISIPCPRHSENYRKHYVPHYRLIEKKYLEDLISHYF